MTTFLDTFTGAAGAPLSGHASDSGGLWTPNTPGSASPVITAAGRLRGSASPGDPLWLSTATFAAPHTLVTATLHVADAGGVFAYVVARAGGAGGGVSAGARVASSPQWELWVGGTLRDAAAFTPSAGHDYALSLALTDTTAALSVDGTPTLSYAGSVGAGTGMGVSLEGTSGDRDTTGWHLDGLSADGQTGAGGGGDTGGGGTTPATARRRVCG